MEAKVKITLQSNNSAAQEIILNAVGFLDVSVGESQGADGQFCRTRHSAYATFRSRRFLALLRPDSALCFSEPNSSGESYCARARAWTHTRISYYRTRSLHAQGQQRTLTVSYRVVDPIDGLHFSVPDERCVVGGRSFCGLSSCLASCPIFRLLGVRLIIPQLSEAAARGGLGQRD